MKASKFSDAQKAFILKQGDDGVPVAEICRKAGISQATYFNWKKKYAGLLPDEMRRLKQLEDENNRLKKIVADLTLGPRDAAGRHSPKALRPARKRKLVDGMLADWGISIRRACKALKFDTSTYHYKSRRTGQAGLEQRIREICETRVRYGYRRVHVLLRREGWMINMKKTRRIYNELGLQLRNKHPKRRVKAKLSSLSGVCSLLAVLSRWRFLRGQAMRVSINCLSPRAKSSQRGMCWQCSIASRSMSLH
jgi:hypothetical protein